ncbi:MAG: agmatine deiminase family protein, partial [Anaerolineae bacterium]|nr:agmatine deiminase family protein [Anaerolineae bacterium]
KVIWLRSGLYGDETDGHIDNIAAFTSKGVVTALGCKDKDDYNYEILRENISILEHETDAHGKNLSIHVIEQPDPIFENERRLTASYINFYFVNGGLIFPIFNQKKDKIALDAIKKIVENRKIIPIRSDRLILGGGGIHCMTQQWPI